MDEHDILITEYNLIRKKILGLKSHELNLMNSLDKTFNNKEHKNNKAYSINRLENELKNVRGEMRYFETYILSMQKKIDAYEIDAENQKNIIINDQLEKERLITKEYVERMRHNTNIQKENKPYDVFISHSSDDKDEFVRPLAYELKEINIKVWYDEFELKIGDSLRESIDKGLRSSRFGIVVLSNSFFARKWANYELNGFLSIELNNNKTILPIWHKVTKDDVINFSPSLADKFALNSSTKTIKEIAFEIKKLL